MKLKIEIEKEITLFHKLTTKQEGLNKMFTV